MLRNFDDESAERMLQRYYEGLLTKEEMEEFLELQRHRSELRERVLQAGREPGKGKKGTPY